LQTSLDLSGLPEPIADEICRLVETFRANLRNGQPAEKHGNDMSIEEFDALLDEITEGLPSLPPLPPDFSRADIYDDHD
jgi:hypothetical protein